MVLFVLNTAHAQDAGKFRVGLDLGFADRKSGNGFYLVLEPKYTLSDQTNVGLRYGWTAVLKAVETGDQGELESVKVYTVDSYMATFDYYFIFSRTFTPYVGSGLGYVSPANINMARNGNTRNSSSPDYKPGGKFGFMIRGGFELGKFRYTMEYDAIGKTELKNASGEEYGSMRNSYIGITVGFFVGGGRW